MIRKEYMDSENFDRALAIYLEEISNIPMLSQKEEAGLAQYARQGDKEALMRLTKANLRFVVSVAKEYRNMGIPFLDLINEGNIGLIEAAKRFDERRGYKFISYAVWWIRQSILQAMATQSRIVRIPLNRMGILYKIDRLTRKLKQRYGREITPEDLAEHLDLDVEEITRTLGISNSHLSFEAPIGSNGDDRSLMEVFETELQFSPEEEYKAKALKKDLKKVFSTLSPIESEITTLYFGLSDEKPHTLDELGQRFSISRERVRQIKNKALQRLRHSSRSKRLKHYLN